MRPHAPSCALRCSTRSTFPWPTRSTSPAALAQACQIRDAWLPELSPLMLRLLQTHRELMRYFWEENILRMQHAASERPYYADPLYHHLRDVQDAALDALYLRCRELIGDSDGEWHRTRSDFSFTSGMLPSQPSG
jgi:hypothetical protein